MQWVYSCFQRAKISEWNSVRKKFYGGNIKETRHKIVDYAHLSPVDKPGWTEKLRNKKDLETQLPEKGVFHKLCSQFETSILNLYQRTATRKKNWRKSKYTEGEWINYRNHPLQSKADQNFHAGLTPKWLGFIKLGKYFGRNLLHWYHPRNTTSLFSCFKLDRQRRLGYQRSQLLKRQ